MKNSASRAFLKGKEPGPTEYTVVDFAKSLESAACKVVNTPNLIFLCGGRVGHRRAYGSARDYFHRHLKKKAAGIAQRVKLAEDVNVWFHNRPEFPDLLELENYLADLADLTILFVESPGSIAELGAFAASDVLRPKTLAVLNSFRSSERSFISDGPVKKIRNENEQFLYSYGWDPRKLNSQATLREFRDMSVELTAFLAGREHPREQLLQTDNRGHAMLIVADLVRIAGVATKTDLAESLRSLGFDPDAVRLDRCLSLLESMSFVSRDLRGRGLQPFYFDGEFARSFIQYAYRADAPVRDILRATSDIRASLDAGRRGALRNHLEKLRRGDARRG